jgi:hypothetical protein
VAVSSTADAEEEEEEETANDVGESGGGSSGTNRIRCVACGGTFTRPESLKKHLAVRGDLSFCI